MGENTGDTKLQGGAGAPPVTPAPGPRRALDEAALRPDTVPRQAQRVAARVVAGQALVVVLDSKELHRLNPVGARVWELCDGRSLSAIAEAVAGEFDVARDHALADVRGFVASLYAVGAVELEEA